MSAPTLYFANVCGHAVNVGDISVVSPARNDQLHPTADTPADGVRITFRSKGNSIFVHGITPTEFMDQLAGAVNLALPN